jgi:hypothetical protein
MLQNAQLSSLTRCCMRRRSGIPSPWIPALGLTSSAGMTKGALSSSLTGQRHSGKAADAAKRATVIPDEARHAPKIGDPFTMDSRTRPNGLGRNDKGALSSSLTRRGTRRRSGIPSPWIPALGRTSSAVMTTRSKIKRD